MTENALVTFRTQMDKMTVEFAKALPPHLTADRLYRTTINAVQAAQRGGKNYLLDADRNSLISAIMTSAVLGLEPDGVTGQGYLIPFRGKVQFIPGYKGLISLAFNSGYALTGTIIREHDSFSYQEGSDPWVRHAPAFNTDRGEIIGAYAVARNSTAPHVQMVMDMGQVLKVRDGSAGYKSNPSASTWSVDFEAMVRKTPIRRLGGNLPLNVQKAMALETQHDMGNHATITPEGTVVQDDGSEVLPPEVKS
jgi:recombination protein RecT